MLQKSIRHLSIIHWRNRDIGLEVFLELTSPPIFLETLYLWGRLSVLPLWISSLSYLIELSLRENFLDGELLGQLEKLPSLVSLKLYHESFMGTHLCFEKKKLFPRLKKLIIDNAPNLDELRFDGGAPNLESLTLAFEREPANGIFGIENLPKLMEVEFFGETIVDSLVQGMIAEAKFHPNRPRVYIEKIELSRTTPNNPVDIIDPMYVDNIYISFCGLLDCFSIFFAQKTGRQSNTYYC